MHQTSEGCIILNFIIYINDVRTISKSCIVFFYFSTDVVYRQPALQHIILRDKDNIIIRQLLVYFTLWQAVSIQQTQMIACSACCSATAVVLYFYIEELTVFFLRQNVQLQVMS